MQISDRVADLDSCFHRRLGIYHFKGQRWYANTNNGAFVSEQEADLAGDRATLNGQ